MSDLVGLPPTFGFCIGGGLGGGPSGLDGLVVAMEAGLLAWDFLPDSDLVGLLCFLGVMGGGCLLFLTSEAVEVEATILG